MRLKLKNLLSWFNNVANVSALLAFGLMLVLTSVGGGGTELYYRWLMIIIIGLEIAGMLLLFPAAGLLQNQSRDCLNRFIV